MSVDLSNWSELALVDFYLGMTRNEVLLPSKQETIAAVRTELQQRGLVDERGELTKTGNAVYKQLLHKWKQQQRYDELAADFKRRQRGPKG